MNIPTHKLINDLRLCADSTADCMCCDFSDGKPHCMDRLLEYTANRLEELDTEKPDITIHTN